MGIRPLQLDITTGTSNNDTVPTLGKVEDLVGTVDTWDEVMHLGNTFTVLDTENISATITQNDTTNNPAALIIANTGTGNDITLPNSSYIKNGAMALAGALTIDTINEFTGSAGVTIESVWLSAGLVGAQNQGAGHGIDVSGNLSNGNASARINKSQTIANSSIMFSDQNTSKFTVGLLGDNDFHIDGAGNWFKLGQAAGEAYFPAVYADAVSTSTKVLSIDSAGQIGISTTSSPTFAGLTVNADADTTIALGRAKLGSPITDIMYLSHYDTNNTTDYAIKQLASGRTCLNAKASTQVDICVNNVAQVNVTATATTIGKELDVSGIILGSGTIGAGEDLAAAGAGARMIWYPKKAAFRAGDVDGTQWNDASVGGQSVAMGTDTTASGSYSFAAGSGCTASGGGSVALGRDTTASNSYSFAAGTGSTASGNTSTALGDTTTASGNGSTSVGRLTTAQAAWSFVCGRWNVIAGSTSSWVLSDPILVVGIGTADGARANAMTVLKNGKVFTPTVYTDAISTATKVLSIDSSGQIGISTTSSPTFAQVTVDNLRLDGNTLASSSGNINIIPDNPADDIIINAHWDFDGKTLVAISDSDTTITAYAGKNITIEGVTFDGGSLAASNTGNGAGITVNGNATSGDATLEINKTATADVGRIYFKFGGAVKYYFDHTADNHFQLYNNVRSKIAFECNNSDDYVHFPNSISVAADADATIELGRAKISSPVSDVAYFSHFDCATTTDYAVKQTTGGVTNINAKTGQSIIFSIANAQKGQWAAAGMGVLGTLSASTTITAGTGLTVTSGNISVGGYVEQHGIFASIYVAGASAAQQIATGATYVKSTAFTTNGEYANCTPDSDSDLISITKSGKYRVTASVCAKSGTANVIWEGVASLGGVAKTNLHWKRKLTTTTDVGNMGFNDFLDVTSVPIDLDLRLRHDNGGGVNITIEYATLNVEYVGAT